MDQTAKQMRAGYIANELIQQGAHSVTLWGSAFDHFSKTWHSKETTTLEVSDRLTVKLIKGIGYKKNISWRRFLDHRIVAKKFKVLAPLCQKPDVMVVSMPPHDLAYEAVRFATKHNIPVIVDIRDPWPDLFLNHVPKLLRPLLKWVLRNDFLWLEETLRDATCIFAVSKSFLSWGLRYAGRKKEDRDQVFYLGGGKFISPQTISKKMRMIQEKVTGKFVVTFLGSFGYYHRPEILVECAARLSTSNIYFIIAGDGEFFSKIKSQAAVLTNIMFPGWLSQDEINALLTISHAGVCPTSYDVDLFPNKAFAYFSAGLPVFSAFNGDLKEIIETHHVGYHHEPGDGETLASQLLGLARDPLLYDQMRDRIKLLFDVSFDSATINREYARQIVELGQNKSN